MVGWDTAQHHQKSHLNTQISWALLAALLAAGANLHPRGQIHQSIRITEGDPQGFLIQLIVHVHGTLHP